MTNPEVRIPGSASTHGALVIFSPSHVLCGQGFVEVGRLWNLESHRIGKEPPTLRGRVVVHRDGTLYKGAFLCLALVLGWGP